MQLNEPTIQGTVEAALARFTGECVRLRGASRTDAGAHAGGQVVDFLTCSRHSAERYVPALNYYLPTDIRVLDARFVAADFHSRRWATSRVYEYRLLRRKEPTALYRFTHLWVKEDLDIQRMAEAATSLVGAHDFRPLAVGHPADRSAVRTVNRWDVDQDGEFIRIQCEANGFLKHQIRKANGILLAIGKGKQPVELMERTLSGLGNVPEVAPLPAKGLCLMEVKYPDGAFDAPLMESSRNL